MAVALPKYRFTVRDYHRMVDAGILEEDARVELIEGEVVPMSPVGPPHGASVDRATRVFVRRCGDRAIVRVQGAVELDLHNEPQPDLLLLRPRDDFYASDQPGPGDVLLAIEVSDTTLRRDRRVKLPLYARTGIPELWIWNLKARRLEVCRNPSHAGYADLTVLGPEEPVSPLLLPDLTFTALDLFGA